MRSSITTIGKWMLVKADRLGIATPDIIYGFGDRWLQLVSTTPTEEAHAVADVLYREYEPDSVIDFGCGLGRYLTGFQAHGATVHGVEGFSEAREHAEIPADALTIHDLREPLELDDHYDLALCIETAEHIPSRFADTLVETVTAAAPRVVFTAAPPGLRGTHHVNEAPREYWIEKFRSNGFSYAPEETDRLQESVRSEIDAADWVADRPFIFVRR
ncbi:class I SAM-dependent methyltransferase [Halomicroarcula sp. F13]|uniref:Class I SAM-dependent methyltransferase n=1 Tax=Haloarcula rubra TaxID=2487747 RepID=A0AAW4PTP0_9EURY|nr:methyltransferase domain-containing protein [Halomicroarcula rubra]MBX0324363.1 class I SAM-dependent methyltransferase [Halomicroarcula rubra]